MDIIVWAAPVVAVITLVGFVFTNNSANDRKVSRVYKRLDEVKDKNDRIFVRREICEVLNKQLRDDVAEIKTDVKKLLQKNGVK
jgi:DnaJ-domain-containing protein 1